MIRLNWCDACGGGSNFGDQLGPILLRHYGLKVQWASPVTCTHISVGSILSKVPNGWTGTVLGTGFIQAGMRKDLGRARVLALRGIATKRACNLPKGCKPVLGDFGILVVDLPRTPHSPTKVLCIPHSIDHDMVLRHPGAVALSATTPYRVLLGAIESADLVYSSSLHGIIAADALGVPHIWEPHHNVKGGAFKFNDYASAFGERISPNVRRLTPRPAMDRKISELRGLVGLL